MKRGRVLAHSLRIQSVTSGNASGSCVVLPEQVQGGAQLAFSPPPFNAREDLSPLDGAPVSGWVLPPQLNFLRNVSTDKSRTVPQRWRVLFVFHFIKLTIEMIYLVTLASPEVR